MSRPPKKNWRYLESQDKDDWRMSKETQEAEDGQNIKQRGYPRRRLIPPLPAGIPVPHARER